MESGSLVWSFISGLRRLESFESSSSIFNFNSNNPHHAKSMIDERSLRDKETFTITSIFIKTDQ